MASVAVGSAYSEIFCRSQEFYGSKLHNFDKVAAFVIRPPIVCPGTTKQILRLVTVIP